MQKLKLQTAICRLDVQIKEKQANLIATVSSEKLEYKML